MSNYVNLSPRCFFSSFLFFWKRGSFNAECHLLVCFSPTAMACYGRFVVSNTRKLGYDSFILEEPYIFSDGNQGLPSSLGGGWPKGLFAPVFGAFFLTCGCEFHEELQGGEGNFLTSWRSFWVIRVKCKNRAAYKVGPDAPVIRELWSPEINGRALNGFLPGVISPYWKGPHFSPFITGLNLPKLWDWRIKAKLPDEEGGKIELQDGVSSVFVKL